MKRDGVRIGRRIELRTVVRTNPITGAKYLNAEIYAHGIRRYRLYARQLHRFGIHLDPEVSDNVRLAIRFIRLKSGPVRVRWTQHSVLMNGYPMCRRGFVRGTGLNGPRRGTREYAIILAGTY